MTDFLTLFHFIRPWWFLALIPVIALTVLLWMNQKNSQQWQRFISPHLLPHLLDTVQIKQKRWPLLGIAALWLTCIIALAGPAWEKVPQPVEQDISALVICWDLSPSMLAEDVKPSRLVRSRLKIIDLLQSRPEGQVALVAYSGEAYTVTPLTDDIQTIINLLPALSPTTLPTTGSNPEMALEQAHQLLKDAGIIKGDILFITDGIDSSAFEFFENEMSTSPNQLTVWGVGTKEGAPIPLPSGGFAKDHGNMVLAKLNENALLALTSKINAYYVPMQTMDNDIKSINNVLESDLDSQTKKTERVFDRWFEHGQYLALLLLPFMAYFFRRGWIFTLFFFVLIPLTPTQSVHAFGWQDLWTTQDQQAQKSLELGDKSAAQNFSTHERRGAELFKQGKFKESSEEYTQGESDIDAYNNGNALTHSKQYDEAIKAYEEALKKNPELEKARNNLDIAKKLAELAKKQEQQQEGEGGESQDEDQKDQEQKDGDKKQKGDQSQESEDGQQSSDKSQDGSKSDQQSDSESEQQSQENKESEEQEQKDNPYSKENTEEEKAAEEKAQEQAKESEDAKKEEEEKSAQEAHKKEQEEKQEQLSEEQKQAMAQTMQMTDEEKEKKQKLEQWLRKVPDDPSGLMRNKFKYEYNKRRRSIQAPNPYSIDDPEERW